MKSLLVDALLQANSGDKGQTLTDSGSYDATDRVLPITANDAVAECSDTAEEATNRRQADDLQELSLEVEVKVREAINEHSIPAAAVTWVADPINEGPVLARFTPHACVLLAIVTAGCWFAYQQLRPTYSESVLGVSQLRASDAQTAQNGSVMNSSVVNRFPFLEDRADSDVAGDLE